MNFVRTNIDPVIIIKPPVFEDIRGSFIKVFHEKLFADQGLHLDLMESYYSISKKDVIRGMHFQAPPMDHTKLVYVTYGAILDVILDIRKGSPTYGQFVTVEISDQDRSVVYIPPGFAHGFLSRQNGTCVTYIQSTMHSPDHDRGVRFDSFGLDWKMPQPIVSKRDQTFPTFAELDTPFTMQSPAS